MTTAEDAYRFGQLFEAELLIELMLRFWNHPLDDDAEFRNALIEAAVDVLNALIRGERLMDGVQPLQMKFVATVCDAEWTTLQGSSLEAAELRQRQNWLNIIRKSVPSCFCAHDALDG